MDLIILCEDFEIAGHKGFCHKVCFNSLIVRSYNTHVCMQVVRNNNGVTLIARFFLEFITVRDLMHIP